MKTGLHQYLLQPTTIIIVFVGTAVLTHFYGGVAFLTGLGIALVALAASKFDWSLFGVTRPKWPKTIYQAAGLAVLIFIGMDILIQPFIEGQFGKLDLSSFDWMRGNLVGYILFSLFMWAIAAFGEEFFYRGYLTKRLAMMLGDKTLGWMVAAVVTSALFGFAHTYQGLSGVVSTGTIGLVFALIFYKNQNNLMLGMLTHGFYDMIGLTLIYLDKDRMVTDLLSTCCNLSSFF